MTQTWGLLGGRQILPESPWDAGAVQDPPGTVRGNPGFSQAVISAVFPLRSSFSLWCQSLGTPERDLFPPALCVMAQREGGSAGGFNLLVPRAAGVAGQGDVFPLAETNGQSQTLWHGAAPSALMG